MSDIIQISTSNTNKTKRAEIDGHVYTVRRPGAGDQLDISSLSSELLSLSKSLITERNRLQSAKSSDNEEEIISRISKKMERFGEKSRKLEACYARLFDDGGDQSKSINLVHTYGIENVVKFIDQIFGKVEDGQASSQ